MSVCVCTCVGTREATPGLGGVSVTVQAFEEQQRISFTHWRQAEGITYLHIHCTLLRLTFSTFQLKYLLRRGVPLELRPHVWSRLAYLSVCQVTVEEGLSLSLPPSLPLSLSLSVSLSLSLSPSLSLSLSLTLYSLPLPLSI